LDVRGLVRLNNGELHKLYASPNIIRMIKLGSMRWSVHVMRMGEMRNTFKIFVVKPEGKSPLRRSRRRWKNNSGIDLRVIGWEMTDCMHLAEARDQ